jgi:hypothetical protein
MNPCEPCLTGAGASATAAAAAGAPGTAAAAATGVAATSAGGVKLEPIASLNPMCRWF